MSADVPVVVVIHGGSWLLVGPAAMRSIDPAVERWRRRGYSVVSVDYRPGKDGLTDIGLALDEVHRKRGSRRLCLYGESAGGHLALLLASKRRDVNCVIASAAPLDLTRLGDELAPIATFLFGPDKPLMEEWSPLERMNTAKAAVMLQAAVDDPVVPIAQQRDFLRRYPKTTHFFLLPGSQRWQHGTASPNALVRAERSEAEFAARVTARGPAEGGCIGAEAMEGACSGVRHSRKVTPPPVRGLGDLWQTVYHPATACREGLFDSDGLEACRLGVDPQEARRHVALIGDSHSAHWRPGLDLVAKDRGWSVTSLYGSGCDYTSLDRDAGNDRQYCEKLRSSVPGWLTENPQIDTVVFSQVARHGRREKEGYEVAWRRMPASVRNVIVIRDNPHAGGPEVLRCIRSAQRREARPGKACASNRRNVLRHDAAFDAASAKADPSRRFFPIDLSDRFCDAKLCYPVLGGLLVYGWLQHQSPSFNRSLGPYLNSRLPAEL